MLQSILTSRHLNRALLARQLLLERARTPLPRALERVGGIQAQYAPSMYIGLWTRLDDFERDALTRALERRSVVEATLMRTTIHLVSARDYWPLTLAIRDPRRESWLKSRKQRPSPREMAAAARRMRTRLRQGPMNRKEVDELVGMGSVGTNGVGQWVDLVRAPPSGTWERRRADIFAAAEEWLGAPDSSQQKGAELLVRRYLGGFGPSSRREIADWAGVPVSVIEPALGRMRLRRFSAEDGEELLDLPRAPIPDPDTPAPVRLLPVWDAALLAHTRRTGILAEEHRPKVFNPRTPQSVNTFLVDGSVAGTWRYEKGRVRIEPFAPRRLDRATRAELDREAEALAKFHS